MKVELIVSNIHQLVTCSSPDGPKRLSGMRDVGAITDGAIAVSDGRIVATGSAEQIASEFDAKELVDAGGFAVTPGFVDPHTHIVFAGDRLDEFELKIKGADYLEILESGGGIISTVRSTRNASVDELVETGLARLDKMLACGTTTCEIKTGYGLETETELKMLAVIERLSNEHAIEIVPTFLAAHAIPPEFKSHPESYVDLVCTEMLPAAWSWYQSSPFAGRTRFFADVFCERNAFDLAQSRRILETALSLGFALKAHVDEFTNLGGSQMAIEMGAVSIDHLDAISESEVESLAKADTIGIVTPTVNFNFGSCYFADARRLIDAGCAIALSTDHNPGSAPCPSQPMAMAIATRYQKLLPAEAFSAATINAAYAIGLGDRSGSIEVGKSADFLILDSADYRAATMEFGGNSVRSVFKSGRLVYESK